ncbi:MAG TPA: pentapeptide repeat-containing protein [Candidatus Nitrosocosmicus sp.]
MTKIISDTNNPQNKDKVIEKLKEKIDKSTENKEPLYCMGYYLPDLKIKQEFKQPVYFRNCKFQQAIFVGATFSDIADFSKATFSREAAFFGATFSAVATFFGSTSKDEAYFNTTFSNVAYFSEATFSDKSYFAGFFRDITFFNYVMFEKPHKIIFKVEDMSRVSFINTDITGVRFDDKVSWGSDPPKWIGSKKSCFKIIEEKWLEENSDKSLGKKSDDPIEKIKTYYWRCFIWV